MNLTSTAGVVHAIAKGYNARSRCGEMTHTATKYQTDREVTCPSCITLTVDDEKATPYSEGMPLVANDGAEVLYGVIVPNPDPSNPRNLVYVKWDSEHIAYAQPLSYDVDDLRDISTHRTCEWFALCFEPAVALRPHPVMPAVPACATHLIWEGK